MMRDVDIVVIGGGPAGLAAAVKAYDSGVRDIVILEREHRLGGILNQCIHNGFGLTRFGESLTGPEYADRFVREVQSRGIQVLTRTTVLSLSRDKVVTAINESDGVFEIKAKSVILAMGCRERSRGALNIPGSRPSGIYSAGQAQKYVNVKGYMVGKRVVILGSGDIGLIMARRMTLEGAKVLAVCEIMPYSSGLRRNIKQCLEDYDIPLYLSHTITEIEGEDRVAGVVVSRVDENKRPIEGTEMHFDCDTVLFSVGLIPENELTKGAGIPLSSATRGAIVYQDRQTEIDGVYACGNVLQVHDLVDYVSEEAEIAGEASASYIRNGARDRDVVSVFAGDNVSYVLPQMYDRADCGDVKVFFRVRGVYRNPTVYVRSGDKVLVQRKRLVCVPGEMETITIPSTLTRMIDGDITVSVEEGV